MSTSLIKRSLRRIPGLVPAYRQAKLLVGIAYERWWEDPRQASDAAQLEGDYDFEAPGELERHNRLLAQLALRRGPGPWGEVLELGCADGVFTAQLARRCSRLVACDISFVACTRAAERCAQFPHVRIQQLDITRDPVAGPYDLIFAMDVLEMVHGRDLLGRVIRKLVEALRPNGLLAFSAARLPDGLRRTWWMRWFPEGGDSLVAFMDGRFGLRRVHLEEHPEPAREIPFYLDHLLALFEKA